MKVARALVLWPLAATAAEPTALIDATDPIGILEVARGYGAADIGKDHLGDPRITGTIEGMAYEVAFFGCEGGRDCTNLMFQAGFATAHPTEAEIGAWNRERRFGKAYLTGDGVPVVEYNVNLQGGVTHLNLDHSFDWWKVVLVEFADYLD